MVIFFMNVISVINITLQVSPVIPGFVHPAIIHIKIILNQFIQIKKLNYFYIVLLKELLKNYKTYVKIDKRSK